MPRTAETRVQASSKYQVAPRPWAVSCPPKGGADTPFSSHSAWASGQKGPESLPGSGCSGQPGSPKSQVPAEWFRFGWAASQLSRPALALPLAPPPPAPPLLTPSLDQPWGGQQLRGGSYLLHRPPRRSTPGLPPGSLPPPCPLHSGALWVPIPEYAGSFSCHPWA